MLGREEGSWAEPSPFWWRLADKALLSGTRRGSHEWLCKQPKREGTFPLAESAVKRFPVTVIAVFGGIVSVVGGQGKVGRVAPRGMEPAGLPAGSEGQHPREPGARCPGALGEPRGVLDKQAGFHAAFSELSPLS